MAAGTIANFFMQNNEKIYDGKLISTFTLRCFRNTPKILAEECVIHYLRFLMGESGMIEDVLTLSDHAKVQVYG